MMEINGKISGCYHFNYFRNCSSKPPFKKREESLCTCARGAHTYMLQFIFIPICLWNLGVPWVHEGDIWKCSRSPITPLMRNQIDANSDYFVPGAGLRVGSASLVLHHHGGPHAYGLLGGGLRWTWGRGRAGWAWPFFPIFPHLPHCPPWISTQYCGSFGPGLAPAA